MNVTVLGSGYVGLVTAACLAEIGNGGTRGEQWSRLRELLDDARSYSRRRADFERAATRPFSATRLDLEALVPVVEGRLPLLLSVDRASDPQSETAAETTAAR